MSDHPDTDLTDPHGEAETSRKENERLRDALHELTQPTALRVLPTFTSANATDKAALERSVGERLKYETRLAASAWRRGYWQDRAEAAEAALDELRAAAPDWPEAARDMLSTWDTWIGGEASERRADADRLLRAGIFAAQAYEDAVASIAPDSAAGYLLRTFLVALIDWKDPQLDPLRAVNRVAASRAHDPVANAGSCQSGDLISRAAAIEAEGTLARTAAGFYFGAGVSECGRLSETAKEVIRAIPAARDAAMRNEGRKSVKVKPLVWNDFDGQGAKASGFYQANYLVTLWRGRGQFEVSVSYPGYQARFDGEPWHSTMESAKAAAQADYEARILAALEPESGE